ncbi:MAG: protein TolR [Candidatus Binatia bacterium]|nr:protein TolR [Candidatus Binatia bacterium]
MAFEQQQEESISQINITPFVDVMLVLLVIFMVTAPILQQGVHVDLPEVASGPLEGSDEQLVVSVTRDGKVLLNDSPVKVEELSQKLRTILHLRPDRAVYLRADKNIAYGRVVEVMAAVRDAGVRKLGMVTEPLETQQ